MSSARENIMKRIRRANEHCSDISSEEMLAQRTSQHTQGPKAQWTEELMTRFVMKAEQSAASVAKVETEQAIVEAVEAYLEEQSLGNQLLCANTPLINSLKWPEKMSVAARTATTDDKVVLVEAFSAISETGSIVMCSSEATPVSLNFLPDYFVCVVRRKSIVNHIEDVWQKIREQGAGMPRAVNIITGPSRTADVEQIIQMGAHGPRKVHLLLLD